MTDTRRPEDPPAHGPGEEAEGDGSQNPVPVSDPGAGIGDPGVAADVPEEWQKKTQRPTWVQDRDTISAQARGTTEKGTEAKNDEAVHRQVQIDVVGKQGTSAAQHSRHQPGLDERPGQPARHAPGHRFLEKY